MYGVDVAITLEGLWESAGCCWEGLWVPFPSLWEGRCGPRAPLHSLGCLPSGGRGTFQGKAGRPVPPY